MEDLHAATDKRPTKEHNNITSKLSYYEDINTNNTPKLQVKQPHTYTTTEPLNRTDTNKTSPTQHIYKALDKTPHTSNPRRPTQTHTTNSTPQNYTKHQTKGRIITPIIIDNLKPQTDLNITKQQLQHAFPGKTFTARQLKKGGIVISPEKQEDVNAFLKHDKYNPQYFCQHLYIHFPHSDSDQRPWLCINKVPLAHNINDIKSQLINIDQNIQIYNHQIHTKNTDQMYKLPENWSPQTSMQASNTLCEMCRNLLHTTQLQKRYQEVL